jgi:hypothetical protein
MQTSDAAYGRGGGAWEQALGQTLALTLAQDAQPRSSTRDPQAQSMRLSYSSTPFWSIELPVYLKFVRGQDFGPVLWPKRAPPPAGPFWATFRGLIPFVGTPNRSKISPSEGFQILPEALFTNTEYSVLRNSNS